MRRARELVAASRTRGARITVWGWTDDPTLSPQVSRYTAGVLKRLGFRVRVHLVSHKSFSELSPGAVKKIALIPSGWLDSNADNFFATWLTCSAAFDQGWFCDPRLDRDSRRAKSVEGTRPRVAASLWARADRRAVDRAAWVPLVNPRQLDFVSRRVRNFQHHPYWDVVADQLQLR